MPPVCRHDAGKMISINVKNFPRRVREIKGVVELSLSAICAEECHRTISAFKDLKILAHNVEVAYEECWRNDLYRKNLEECNQVEPDSIWKKILDLRSSGILEVQCNKEFEEAVLCVGEKEFQDQPYTWWNYEQYRKMRHTWAEFFRSNL